MIHTNETLDSNTLDNSQPLKPPVKQIEKEIIDTQQSLDILSDRIKALQSKLIPILLKKDLVEELPKELAPPIHQPNIAPLAQRIGDIKECVQNINIRVKNIISGVEI